MRVARRNIIRIITEAVEIWLRVPELTSAFLTCRSQGSGRDQHSGRAAALEHCAVLTLACAHPWGHKAPTVLWAPASLLLCQKDEHLDRLRALLTCSTGVESCS